MRDQLGSLLVDYWAGVSGSRRTASSGSALLKRLAPYIFLLEWDPPSGATYWLVGSALQRIIGRNPQSESYYAGWSREAQVTLTSLLHLAVGAHRPLFLSACGSSARRGEIEFENVLLPVSRDAARKSFLVGISMPVRPEELDGPLTGPQRLRSAGFADEHLDKRGVHALRLAQARNAPSV